jgi:hypothetical protein
MTPEDRHVPPIEVTRSKHPNGPRYAWAWKVTAAHCVAGVPVSWLLGILLNGPLGVMLAFCIGYGLSATVSAAMTPFIVRKLEEAKHR